MCAHFRISQTCLAGPLDGPPQVSYGAPMAVHAGRHQFGTDSDRIILRTSRDGMAATAGHDLTIEASRWSGVLTVGEDLAFGLRNRGLDKTEIERRVSATLDGFDALCAHLATMHPSRYLTLIEGVKAVFLTGVHKLDDQSVALRLVSLTDRLYDAGIPVVASGDKLDTIFSEEMLEGGYRKKYLRATSRLLALTAAGMDL